MENPRKYYSFDIQTNNCEACKAGLLYKACDICGEKQACAGWANDSKVYCCRCYKRQSRSG